MLESKKQIDEILKNNAKISEKYWAEVDEDQDMN
jgi:hypothetical protein